MGSRLLVALAAPLLVFSCAGAAPATGTADTAQADTETSDAEQPSTTDETGPSELASEESRSEEPQVEESPPTPRQAVPPARAPGPPLPLWTRWRELQRAASGIYLAQWRAEARDDAPGLMFCAEPIRRLHPRGGAMPARVCGSSLDMAFRSPRRDGPMPDQEQAWVVTRGSGDDEHMVVATEDECAGRPCGQLPREHILENLVCTWLGRAHHEQLQPGPRHFVPDAETRCSVATDCELVPLVTGAIAVRPSAATPYRELGQRYAEACADPSLAVMGMSINAPAPLRVECVRSRCSLTR